MPLIHLLIVQATHNCSFFASSFFFATYSFCLFEKHPIKLVYLATLHVMFSVTLLVASWSILKKNHYKLQRTSLLRHKIFPISIFFKA